MNDDSLRDAPTAPPVQPGLPAGRSVVLVGIMGAGKTSIGRRLAVRLGLPFRDADLEIEQAAGCSIAEIFARFGEPAFREGEKKVIKRLLAGEPIVLAAGGGAYMDAETRAAIRAGAVSVWLRSTLPVLLRRVAHRTHRPLLNADDPETVLRRLMALRHPIYAEADIAVDCGDETPETTTEMVLRALREHRPPRRMPVALAQRGYDVIVGEGLLARSGSLLGPVLPQRRAVVVTDEHVAGLHAPALAAGLAEAGFETGEPIVVPPGETTKSAEVYLRLAGELLDRRVERRTAVIALGGGVVGDLAGFAAATVLRGLPFVQIPTTLLAQVDSSVGGKTGINTRQGKNLLGAFHQPQAVLADVGVLATLPARELRAGYAEIAKAGLIGDAPFFGWCEAHAAALLAGDAAIQAEAVWRACAFKARVVGDDEREEKPNDGRALLNLGHTFAHAVEAECGYGQVLHGEAVAVGLGLAVRLSARLGHCDAALAARVEAHMDACGLPATMGHLNRRLSARQLVAHMARDKKVRDGKLAFVLVRGIGQAFTSSDVPPEAVLATLRESGCVD
ncbi:MAG: 3-dehydroquinate synthase [Rhodospirillales bacterium]|nr:3-dehydroquinate synthase [Rhodospirillales bacterium]